MTQCNIYEVNPHKRSPRHNLQLGVREIYFPDRYHKERGEENVDKQIECENGDGPLVSLSELCLLAANGRDVHIFMQSYMTLTIFASIDHFA